MAIHHFTDVPTNHPFHDQISSVADAGITTGFEDGTYRPGNNITRQAAAAFFQRGLGRVSFDSASVSLSAGTQASATVASASLDAGAVGTGSGLVWISATFTASKSIANGGCPCEVGWLLMKDGVGISTPSSGVLVPSTESGQEYLSGAANVVTQIDGGTSSSFQLAVTLLDSDALGVSVTGDITVLYVPFGPEADTTAAYEFTACPPESEPNNSAMNGNALPGGGCVAGRIGNASDTDYFFIGVSAGQTLTVETKSTDGAGCEGDTVINVYNSPGGMSISLDDNSGAGACSMAQLVGLSAGTYYVQVSGLGDAFDYRLEAAVTGP